MNRLKYAKFPCIFPVKQGSGWRLVCSRLPPPPTSHHEPSLCYSLCPFPATSGAVPRKKWIPSRLNSLRSSLDGGRTWQISAWRPVLIYGRVINSFWIRFLSDFKSIDFLGDLIFAEHRCLAGKRILIMDRDRKYCERFRSLLEESGTNVLRLPPRSPNLNAYAERFVLSIKQECCAPQKWIPCRLNELRSWFGGGMP